MACNPSSTTTETSGLKKRKRQSSSEEDESSGLTTESPNSSGSGGGSDESIERNIPQDISKWTKEHLIGLSIITLYQEETSPLDLIKMFPQEYSHEQSLTRAYMLSKYFLPNHIDNIEQFFNYFCDFHKSLDEDFRSISGFFANLLRSRNRYSAHEFLESAAFVKKEEMQYWFRRFETCGVNFGQKLYSMVRKRQLKEKDCGEIVFDEPNEYDFQFLFDAFAAMFGLHNYDWYRPFMPKKTMELPHVQVSGKTDVLYCQDLGYTKEDVSRNMRIVAVCQVERQFPEMEQQDCRLPRESGCATSSSLSKYPPHIPLSLLGQHGGNLLLYFNQSVKQDVIFGLIIQETKVTFTALAMTSEQYRNVKMGKHNNPPATLIVTKSYDFMKKDDRKHLIRPLLELALLQEVKYT